VISTVITLGNDSFSAEVTLTARDNMRFRALLGRTALSGQYRVDPSRSFLMGKRKKRKQAANDELPAAAPAESVTP
jgi:hypothetical protein